MLAGVAVTFVMFMTTMIMTVAILVVWGHNVVLAVAFFLIFGLIDASFLTAALSKFTHGGWFPVALAGVPDRHAYQLHMHPLRITCASARGSRHISPLACRDPCQTALSVVCVGPMPV